MLTVVHLLYTTGYAAPSGADLVRADLTARALESRAPDRDAAAGRARGARAARAARGQRGPSDDAHRRRRTAGAAGGPEPGGSWDRAAIEEGHRLVVAALEGGPPGRFALQAAIASLHAHAPSYAETDWAQIVLLYDALERIWPSPVVALNRAIARAEIEGPAAGLAAIEALESEGRLAGYRYLPGTKVDLLRRLGRLDEAVAAYRDALALAENDTERAFLERRLAECGVS